MSALWAQSILPRLDLQPLSTSETIEVVGAALGGPVDEQSARSLSDLARGNMLYLRQVIEGELGAGRLTVDHGMWTWRRGFEPSVALADLVGQTVTQLSAPAREVLDVVAVAGPLDPAVLAGVVDGAQLEAAEERGRGRAVRPGRRELG